MALKTRTMKIGGMTCANCQQKIQKKLENTAGIQDAAVSYNDGTASVTYDTDILSYSDIVSVLQRLGYEALPDTSRPRPKYYRAAGLLLVIAALYLLLEHFGVLNLLAPGQLAQADMTYPMLFVIGLITSVHCVAMCGGITLTQTLGKTEGGRYAALKPAALYNAGRVLSYTAVGFLVGALGSAITFSNTAQGVLKLIAGVFMVSMGLNMLGIFPWLRRLTPRLPAALSGKVHARGAGRGPLVVGLLNGLMPCGPLQAMQIYALSTGSPFKGALSMLLFSLGTVPLMFGLGALSSLLSQRFARRVMTAGAVLVAVLGLSMLTQGWSLTGLSAAAPASLSTAAQGGNTVQTSADGVQVVHSTLSSGKYPDISVQAGVPVQWIIDAPEGSINGCNNRMILPAYGIEHKFETGENVITFTPDTAGKFAYSCWMGMIRATITVTEAGGAEAAQSVSGEDSTAAGSESGESLALPGCACCG